MRSQEGNKDRFLELDACRGIAAAAVVLAHLTLHYELVFGFTSASFDASRHTGTVFLISRLPVYFFFLISGYVIGLTLLSVGTLREFAVYRFARLFPAYWAAVVLTGALLLLFPGIGAEPSGQQWAINLTMTQGLFGVRNIDPVYWSLT